MKTNNIRLTGLIFLLALFTIMNLNCGGDGSSSSGKRTAMSVNLTAATSSDITKLKFTISAPDMGTIERTVDVAVTQISGDLIVVNFDVPNGLNRHVVIEALDAPGAVIYIGDSFVDLDGTAKSIEVTLSPGPKVPRPPRAQVTNNSGGPLYQVNVGNVVFTENLSLCGTGCSTAFLAVAEGENNIIVYQTSASSSVSVGSLGTFQKDNIYEVNIRNVGGYCAELWQRFNISPNANDDLTKVLIGTTCGANPTPTPAPLPSGFPSDVPTGNYTISVSICVEGTCASGQSFTMSNTDINQFAQSMLDALNTASAQQQASCSQSGFTCSLNVVFTPWDGTSFAMTDNISITDCTSGTCTVETGWVKFTITKT